MIDVIVIGAGPAGITAGIYLKRAGLDVLLIEKSAPGGKVNLTSSVENYPGFDLISGPDLAFKFYEHALQQKISIKSANVVSVNQIENNLFEVTTSKEVLQCRALIIATGTSEKKLEIKGSDKFEHKGISYCAVCDGPFFKGKRAVVIGGGESALKEALYLSSICSEVTLVHRREEFRASEELVSKIKNSNIKLALNKIPVEVTGNNGVESLIIEDTIDHHNETIATDCIFPYLGLLANTSFLSNLDIVTNNGFVVVDNQGQSNIQGLYAVGDVVDKKLRQIVTAASDGAIAAQNAIEYLKNK